mmetsp:Transcript_14301/g.21807  ORF Transcript_14301/g.21807 Transcript_14301/m.21807 type:complete len:213 (+) Transcript_14301:13-651(+)
MSCSFQRMFCLFHEWVPLLAIGITAKFEFEALVFFPQRLVFKSQIIHLRSLIQNILGCALLVGNSLSRQIHHSELQVRKFQTSLLQINRCALLLCCDLFQFYRLFSDRLLQMFQSLLLFFHHRISRRQLLFDSFHIFQIGGDFLFHFFTLLLPFLGCIRSILFGITCTCCKRCNLCCITVAWFCRGRRYTRQFSHLFFKIRYELFRLICTAK